MARTEQYRFWIPLYENCRVILSRSTPDAYLRLLQQYDETATIETDRPVGDGRTVLLTHPQRTSRLLIWFRAEADLQKPQWMGLLAHECWHGTCRVLGEVGLEPGPANEEAYAYLQQWLVRECVKRLWPRAAAKRPGRRKK